MTPRRRDAEAPQAGTGRRPRANFRETLETRHAPPLARIARASLAAEKRWIVRRGAFRDISSLHVSRDVFDDVEVDYSGAAIEWEVSPLNAHQVTEHCAARFNHPDPMSEPFDGLLISMERGRPDLTCEERA